MHVQGPKIKSPVKNRHRAQNQAGFRCGCCSEASPLQLHKTKLTHPTSAHSSSCWGNDKPQPPCGLVFVHALIDLTRPRPPLVHLENQLSEQCTDLRTGRGCSLGRRGKETGISTLTCDTVSTAILQPVQIFLFPNVTPAVHLAEILAGYSQAQVFAPLTEM